MRWHVHGTDATTGQPVVLTIDEPDAALAVQAAIHQNVLVSHVHREMGMRWQLFPLVCGLLLAVGAICAGLLFQNLNLQDNLAHTLEEQKHLAQSVARAEQAAADLRHHEPEKVVPVEKVTQLSAELAAARSRMSLTQQQLSAAHQQLDALERAATKVPELQDQLANATARLKEIDSLGSQLKEELTLQQRRTAELNTMKAGAEAATLARVAALEKQNLELQSQLELIKEQLLVTTAQSTVPVAKMMTAQTEPANAPGTDPARRALHASYDTALDFMSLHFDAATIGAVSSGEDEVTASGVWRSNAAAMKFVADRAKEHVFSITLTISLAADAPAEKLAENRKLIADLAKQFAPGLRDPETVAAAAALLTVPNPNRRMVFLGDEYQLSLWNSGEGTYTFRVESPRTETETKQAQISDGGRQ